MGNTSYFLGIDNGGTVIKAVIFDLHGKEIKRASVQTPVITPKPGYTEREMDSLWQANCACIRELFKDPAIQPEQIIGVGLSGHGKGLYAWGDAKPAYNGIVSTDNRAWRHPERWRESGVFEELYPQLCQQLVPGQQVSLLAWMKESEPEVYRSIQWVFSVKDYIRYRLTGVARSELTDISGSGLMDIKAQKIDQCMLERLGVGEIAGKIPPLCRSDEISGYITNEASALCGLCEGTPVTGGMFDIDACAIAMNVTDTQSLCMITGTWSINEFLSTEPIVGTEIAMNSLYAIPNYYLIEECSPTSAGNLDWVIENLLKNDPNPEGQSLYEYANDMVGSIEPGDCDVYYLPFLYGSNAHPLAKASFLGLTTYHSKAHMLRAVYEGVVFSAKTHIDKLLSVRKRPDAIRIAGGVVNSPMWVQMFADILNIPLEIVDGVKELGALGAAIAAAVAVGAYKDYQEAASQMVRVSQPILPNPDLTATYQNKYEKFKALVNALDTVWGLFEV